MPDMKAVKEAIKAINDSGEIEPKIKVVGTSNEDLVSQFTEAVEALSEAKRDIPDVAILAYNAIDEATEPEETEPEKKTVVKPKAKAKAKAKAKVTPKKPALKAKTTAKTTKPAAAKSTVKKDDYGYAVGSKANLFAKSISNKTGKTMKEVKELAWNDKNATFYDVFNRLVEKGLAEKDEKTNKMTIK